MKDGMHIAVRTYCEGECAYFLHELTLEQLEKIEEIIGADLIDDLTIEHPIKIVLQSPVEYRKSMIDGIVFSEGCSYEQARRTVDDEDLLSEEEEEIQQEKEFEELMKNK